MANGTFSTKKLSKAPVILGVLLVLVGLLLTMVGLFLMSHGQSPYFLAVGLGLIASGVLLAVSSKFGLYAYFVTLATIIIWSFIEEKTNMPGLLPRIAVPIIIGLYVSTAKFRSCLH